jgi:hypothetical protein
MGEASFLGRHRLMGWRDDDCALYGVVLYPSITTNPFNLKTLELYTKPQSLPFPLAICRLSDQSLIPSRRVA